MGTKFISCTGSNPTFTATFCQTNDLHIDLYKKVKRMVYLSDRQTSKLDGIIAQDNIQLLPRTKDASKLFSTTISGAGQLSDYFGGF
jgi:hypothetical protein